MKYLRQVTPILSFVLSFLLLWTLLPIPEAYGGGGGTMKVQLPIEEIRGLIEQLEEVGETITGSAGIEIRQSIAALSSELETRLYQLENIGKELWGVVIDDLERQLDKILVSVRRYLNQIDDMAGRRIDQISRELRNRIDQVSDEIAERLDQLDTIIDDALDRIRDIAVESIDRGRTSALIIVDNFTKKIVKVAIIVLIVIALLIIGVSAWRGKLPTKVAQQIVTAVVLVIFFGVCCVFLFSNAALASVLGKEVELVNPDAAKEEGDKAYVDFTNRVKQGVLRKDLVATERIAVAKLEYAKFVATTPAEAKLAQDKIDSVRALMYPPPKPLSPGSDKVVLGASSKYYDARVKALKLTAEKLNIADVDKLYLKVDSLRPDRPVIAPGLLIRPDQPVTNPTIDNP